MAFRLFSNYFSEGATLPTKQVLDGCGHHGDNQSPQLSWEDAPDGTKSFVVTIYDPDAPTGSGLWDWVAIDLTAGIHELPAGAGSGTTALPAGSGQTRNDLGAHEYAGAAPPAGPAHRYVYTVQALSVEKLPLPDASGALVGFMGGMHSLGKATLTANFGVDC